MSNDNDGKGNGKKTIEQMAQEKAYGGLVVRIGELQRQDGIITEAMDKRLGQGLGVIQTIITAEPDDKNYRQIFKRARWKNQEQRDKYVKAYAACRITGAVKGAQTLLDLITADSAGDDGVWIREAIEGLTHTTLTTHEEISKKKKYNDNRNKINSPIG